MAIDPLILEIVAVMVAGGGAAHLGGRRGGTGALNGTADGVKRIETTLNAHVSQTRDDFKEAREQREKIGELAATNSLKIAVLEATKE